jgi:hypothetical protein
MRKSKVAASAVECLCYELRAAVREPNERSKSRRGFLVASVLFASMTAALSAEGGVSQCFGPAGTGLCPVGTETCEVNANVTVDDNAVLDCDDHDLIIANSLGKLTVNGKMTVIARNLTIQNTRSMEAVTALPDPKKAVIVLNLSGTLSLAGRLNAQNIGGGSLIEVTAGQDILLQNGDVGVDVTGSGQSMDGGDVVLQAGRDIRINSKIWANGNDGTTEADQNSGGDVELTAGRNVYVEQLIRAHGRWNNGGSLAIRATDVEINHDHDGTQNGRKGEILLDGHSEDGDGGVLDIQAGGKLLQSGPISLCGGVGNSGGYAQGGTVRIDAGCGGVRLEDDLNAWGGTAGGGSLVVESRGNISAGGVISLNGNTLGGDGGSITLTSRMGNVTLDGTAQLHTNGHVTSNNAEGIGGTVSLYGCQVDITSGAVVESTGKSKGRFEATSLKKGAELNSTFGIRISENADVSSYSTSGAIVLTAATVKTGTCTNSPSTACTLDSDCTVSCTTGDCTGANPQLDGQVLQFSSVPTTQQNTALDACAAQCQ